MSMCALSLKRPLPFTRCRSWYLAFINKNSAVFAEMKALGDAALRRLGVEGENVDDFLDSSWREWALSAGELVFTQASNSAGEQWSEPEHQDGGASILHLGLTVYGHRELVCQQGEQLPPVSVLNVPGTVYLGPVTGCVHQVHHKECPDDYLWSVPKLGRLSVAVMMRTSLFAANRSRLRDTTPSPVPMFHALARVFRETLWRRQVLLPTVAECTAQLFDI